MPKQTSKTPLGQRGEAGGGGRSGRKGCAQQSRKIAGEPGYNHPGDTRLILEEGVSSYHLAHPKRCRAPSNARPPLFRLPTQRLPAARDRAPARRSVATPVKMPQALAQAVANRPDPRPGTARSAQHPRDGPIQTPTAPPLRPLPPAGTGRSFSAGSPRQRQCAGAGKGRSRPRRPPPPPQLASPHLRRIAAGRAPRQPSPLALRPPDLLRGALGPPLCRRSSSSSAAAAAR